MVYGKRNGVYNAGVMLAPLKIEMFGPMRVLVGGAPLPPLRSRKALWLLGLLALRHGRSVSREWVAGTLWPDSEGSASFNNLRPVIFELRKALGDQAFRLRSPDRVTVVLDLQGADVDLLDFDRAIAKGDHERAVALYAGPLLEGCPEEWAPQERNAREQDCARALQALGDAAYESGDYAGAIERYRRLAAMDPWRDAPRRGIMKALAKSGDVNAALYTYRDFAQTLRNEGGLAPDEKTTALYQKVRALAQQGTRVPCWAKESTQAVGRLSHALTALIGREDERLGVAAELREHRLVTLLGLGGIGKTRLATEVARENAAEYPDGAWLVTLEALGEERAALAHVMASLSIARQPGRNDLDTLTEALREKRMLLVLDNCEHLRATSSHLVTGLLSECGGLRVLATSREALGVPGERLWPVPALATPDPDHLPQGATPLLRVLSSYESVQLFVDRARGANPSFEMTESNGHAVAEICARLEGVPLAIELAAARAKAMTPAQIAARLEDRLQLLAVGHRSEPTRHQTLRATLDWSYVLLTEREKTLLRRLAAFGEGWTLEAAERACAGDDVSDLHGALVDKSLVVFDARQGRFRLLEMVRQYAAAKGAETAPLAGARRVG